MKSKIAIALVAGLWFGCAGTSAPQSGTAVVACDGSLFSSSPDEHSVHYEKSIVRSRSASGTALPVHSDLWPTDWPVTMTVRSLEDMNRSWSVSIDERGRFDLEKARPGHYCAKVEARGYESVVFAWDIDRSAAERDVSIRLDLGI